MNHGEMNTHTRGSFGQTVFQEEALFDPWLLYFTETVPIVIYFPFSNLFLNIQTQRNEGTDLSIGQKSLK